MAEGTDKKTAEAEKPDGDAKPAAKKQSGVRRDRFGWAKDDIEWVVSPEQAAEKAKKKPDGDAKPAKKNEEDDS